MCEGGWVEKTAKMINDDDDNNNDKEKCLQYNYKKGKVHYYDNDYYCL